MTAVNAFPREPSDVVFIEGTTPSTPHSPLQLMTTLTYRGIAYTPAEGKAAAAKADGLIYRGCTTRAVIEPTVAPTLTRTWFGHNYQLAF